MAVDLGCGSYWAQKSHLAIEQVPTWLITCVAVDGRHGFQSKNAHNVSEGCGGKDGRKVAKFVLQA